MNLRRRTLLTASVALLGASGLAACSAAAGGREVTVFAAASLEHPLREILAEVEAREPDLRITLIVDGSANLVTQILEGAPADVIATADLRSLRPLIEDGLVEGEPQIFASNSLALITPADNPAKLSSWEQVDAATADAATAEAATDLRLVTCAATVPCGVATTEFATAAGLTLHPVSEESSVTGVLSKVTSGEADAGFVYSTDVRRAGTHVRELPLPTELVPLTLCPIAPVMRKDPTPDTQLILDAVLGVRGQEILRHAGFGEPGKRTP